jgi:hypothetical protein
MHRSIDAPPLRRTMNRSIDASSLPRNIQVNTVVEDEILMSREKLAPRVCEGRKEGVRQQPPAGRLQGVTLNQPLGAITSSSNLVGGTSLAIPGQENLQVERNRIFRLREQPDLKMEFRLSNESCFSAGGHSP